MDFIKKYKPNHYTKHIKKINELIGKYDSVDDWLKSLGASSIELLVKHMDYLLKNNQYHKNESEAILTLIIRLFMLELDIEENQIVLNDTQLKKITRRFNKALRKEYGIRNNFIVVKRDKYTLLTD